MQGMRPLSMNLPSLMIGVTKNMHPGIGRPPRERAAVPLEPRPEDSGPKTTIGKTTIGIMNFNARFSTRCESQTIFSSHFQYIGNEDSTKRRDLGEHGWFAGIPPPPGS
jgi:hypothetical protein